MAVNKPADILITGDDGMVRTLRGRTTVERQPPPVVLSNRRLAGPRPSISAKPSASLG